MTQQSTHSSVGAFSCLGSLRSIVLFVSSDVHSLLQHIRPSFYCPADCGHCSFMSRWFPPVVCSGLHASYATAVINTTITQLDLSHSLTLSHICSIIMATTWQGDNVVNSVLLYSLSTSSARFVRNCNQSLPLRSGWHLPHRT